jgi:hypothetical protein
MKRKVGNGKCAYSDGPKKYLLGGETSSGQVNQNVSIPLTVLSFLNFNDGSTFRP